MAIKIRRIQATRNPTQQRGALVMVRQLSLVELCEVSEPSKWDLLTLPPFVLMLPPFVFTLGRESPLQETIPAVSDGLG